MSKRHQSNRRKSYGRRQHEVAERRHHETQPDVADRGTDEVAPAAHVDRFAFLDLRASRLRFAMGD